MSKTILILTVIFVGFSIFCISCQGEKTIPQKTEEPALFQFPEISSIDSAIYDEIKETCRTYWNLDEMIKDTFEIRKDKTEYSIHCDGYSEGELYHFVVRVDKNGKWINDGRSLKKS
jgi:hypothetical protein